MNELPLQLSMRADLYTPSSIAHIFFWNETTNYFNLILLKRKQTDENQIESDWELWQENSLKQLIRNKQICASNIYMKFKVSNRCNHNHFALKLSWFGSVIVWWNDLIELLICHFGMLMKKILSITQ